MISGSRPEAGGPRFLQPNTCRGTSRCEAPLSWTVLDLVLFGKARSLAKGDRCQKMNFRANWSWRGVLRVLKIRPKFVSL